MTSPGYESRFTARHCLLGRAHVRAQFKSRPVAIAFICCAVSVATWFSIKWWPQHNPQDFEQCSEKAQRTASSKDERISLTAQCDKQFVGRRKIGGGYTFRYRGTEPNTERTETLRRGVHVISGYPTTRCSRSSHCRTTEPKRASRCSGRSSNGLDVFARATHGDHSD